VVFFLGAVQLISIGILGEYIGRIYEEIKGRPLYTLSEIGGFQAGFQNSPESLRATQAQIRESMRGESIRESDG
jgi:polyisoprenyl-phosphate glycosyltransferase